MLGSLVFPRLIRLHDRSYQYYFIRRKYLCVLVCLSEAMV